MQFRIADSFSKALGKLTAQEQSAAKVAVFDLQQDPAAPGLQFHRIDKSKDPNFWSIRVNRDLRIVVHKTSASFLICYIAHHDDAYGWAERRRIEAHPRTGAAQIVEVRERIEEITRPVHVPQVPLAEVADVPQAPLRKPLFDGLSLDDLLAVGVPADWAEDLRQSTEDEFLALFDHMPGEAAEALLEYAATGILHRPEMVQAGIDPFEHPDAQRRFRVMENTEELARALDYPWDQWAVFLHPSQRQVVDQDFGGPARVSGSAGTGKTVVALHRTARFLADNPKARVLLTTFSSPLANALSHKLNLLTGANKEIASRATVLPFQGVARDLFALAFGHTPRSASDEHMVAALKAAAAEAGDSGFTDRFLRSEWKNVVDAWQVTAPEGYRDVPRLGRRSRLGAKQWERLWPIFSRTREILEGQGLLTWPAIYGRVADHYAGRAEKPFDYIVVDEAQDLAVPELRMFAAISGGDGNALFFAGDLGQRIFQEPFSWLALGVDIRGRSKILKVNYRTSHQIREAADRLLPTAVRDVDGNEEDRRGTVSVFNGPAPEVHVLDDQDVETSAVAEWIKGMIADGVEAEEIGVFVRSEAELGRARAAVRQAGGRVLELSDRVEDRSGRISIGTMHLAKGLEFKAVVVMACDDDILPLQARVETAADDSELTEVFETERHLFYVACTRARDRLLVSGVAPGSEFFEDLAV